MIPATGDPVPYLYILARTDLSSMNPGKMAAQVAHAANDFMATISKPTMNDSSWQMMYDHWRYDDTNGRWLTFGTTIVMDGIDEDTINNVVSYCSEAGSIISGTIVDPTYPIKDGKVMHFIPLLTCGWVFCYKGDTKWTEISKKHGLKLHK